MNLIFTNECCKGNKYFVIPNKISTFAGRAARKPLLPLRKGRRPPLRRGKRHRPVGRNTYHTVHYGTIYKIFLKLKRDIEINLYLKKISLKLNGLCYNINIKRNFNLCGSRVLFPLNFKFNVFLT